MIPLKTPAMSIRCRYCCWSASRRNLNAGRISALVVDIERSLIDFESCHHRLVMSNVPMPIATSLEQRCYLVSLGKQFLPKLFLLGLRLGGTVRYSSGPRGLPVINPCSENEPFAERGPAKENEGEPCRTTPKKPSQGDHSINEDLIRY